MWQGTLLMAMAHSLPIVSTPTHHALELLQNNRGLIIPYHNNDSALAEALNALLGSAKLRITMVRELLPFMTSGMPCTTYGACKGRNGPAPEGERTSDNLVAHMHANT